jgi:hypothetical protein
LAVRAITSLFTPECKGLTITGICDPGHGISASGSSILHFATVNLGPM